MQLETKHIEDWSEFIAQNDEINLQCSDCDGTGRVKPECGKCAGTGVTDSAKSFIGEDCPACNGNGTLEEEECDACGGDGYAEPMWNTIWNTGFSTNRHVPLFPGPNVFAFAYEGEIWFGLTGCGMDFTPCLALAWINAFPDCNWLPDQFCVTGCNLTGGYISSCIGADNALRVYKLMESTYRGQLEQAKNNLAEIRNVLKNLKSKPKAKTGKCKKSR